MLEVKQLSFFYEFRKHFYLPKERVFVLREIDFSLPSGENLLIEGESGCGKSTLGKIIAGMLQASQGEVRFNHRLITGISPQEIQYVFQDQKTALNPHQTIQTAIMSVAKNFNLTLNLPSLLHSFGLKEHILSLKPINLSSGEAQRVGLLRALMLKPKVLICDEITTSLDLVTALQSLEILKRYQSQHQVSYLFISHLSSLFSPFCSRSLKLS